MQKEKSITVATKFKKKNQTVHDCHRMTKYSGLDSTLKQSHFSSEPWAGTLFTAPGFSKPIQPGQIPHFNFSIKKKKKIKIKLARSTQRFQRDVTINQRRQNGMTAITESKRAHGYQTLMAQVFTCIFLSQTRSEILVDSHLEISGLQDYFRVATFRAL